MLRSFLFSFSNSNRSPSFESILDVSFGMKTDWKRPIAPQVGELGEAQRRGLHEVCEWWLRLADELRLAVIVAQIIYQLPC